MSFFLKWYFFYFLFFLEHEQDCCLCCHTIFVGGLGFAPVDSAFDTFAVDLMLIVMTMIMIVFLRILAAVMTDATLMRGV